MYHRAKPVIDKIEQMMRDPEQIKSLREGLKEWYQKLYRTTRPMAWNCESWDRLRKL